MIKFLLDILNWFDAGSVRKWLINKVVYNNQKDVDVAAFHKRYATLCTLIDQEFIDATVNNKRVYIGYSPSFQRKVFKDDLSQEWLYQLEDNVYDRFAEQDNRYNLSDAERTININPDPRQGISFRITLTQDYINQILTPNYTYHFTHIEGV